MDIENLKNDLRRKEHPLSSSPDLTGYTIIPDSSVMLCPDFLKSERLLASLVSEQKATILILEDELYKVRSPENPDREKIVSFIEHLAALNYAKVLKTASDLKDQHLFFIAMGFSEENKVMVITQSKKQADYLIFMKSALYKLRHKTMRVCSLTPEALKEY